MDPRLSEAARAGNTEALAQILNDDPLILHRVTLTPSDSPLHVACLLSHVGFARLLMERNNDLAWDRDQQGLTPLHLAAAKGHLEMVKDLLRIDKELCRVKDQRGRIALHCAAIKGKTDVAQLLIKAYPQTASEPTPRGETLLHLAVINNRFEALAPLIGFLRDEKMDMKELLNSKNGDGQTILHLAVQLQSFQMVKLIANETNVDLSAKNSVNLTALEMAELRRRADGSVDSKDIEDVLRVAAAGGGDYNQNQEHQIQINGGNNSNKILSRLSEVIKKRGRFNTNTINAVMVIAILAASLSFQAALSSPGGVWQDWANTTTTTTNTNTTNQGMSRGGVSLAPAHPPAPLYSIYQSPGFTHIIRSVLEHPVNFSKSVPSHIKEVRDENRRMPGKSVARELYADDFLDFIYSCALCYTLSIFTIVLAPLYSDLSNFNLAGFGMGVLGILVCMNVFYRGIALVTDKDLSFWVAVHAMWACLIDSYFIVIPVTLLSLLTHRRFWKWMSKKIYGVTRNG